MHTVQVLLIMFLICSVSYEGSISYCNAVFMMLSAATLQYSFHHTAELRLLGI